MIEPDAVAVIVPLLSSATLYAGIGSRATPASVLRLMEKLGEWLGRRHVLLRSGGAPGAEAAFELGCNRGNGPKEIFLPWPDFNHHPSPLSRPSDGAEFVASLCHPNWRACGYVARKFHARNCHQIAGQSLVRPVHFVLYWANERSGIAPGGTATALTLARKLNIPTFNLKEPSIQEAWLRVLKSSPIPLQPFH